MKKIMSVLLGMVVLSGCASYDFAYKMQNGYFDQNGKRAGYSGFHPCMRQGQQEAEIGVLGTCAKSARCMELAETCMKEKGFVEAKTFETSVERMALYRKAYEEDWIKPGMTRLEVVSLLGAPQIATYQLIPPRKIWWYCRNTTKTALIGFNFVLQITWYEDKVESIERRFKI